MSDMDIQAVLAQMRSIKVDAGGTGGAGGAAQAAAPGGFADLLARSVDAVATEQNKSAALSAAFESGAPGVELTDVMLQMQKASLSFRAMTEVRNRLVSAYQDVMNMPV